MENIGIRENSKIIKIGDRSFRINKFDAMKGSFILFKVMKILTPIFSSDAIKTFRAAKSVEEVDIGNINFTEIMSGLTDMKEEDFVYIQTNCLKTCSEILPSGDVRVLNDNNTYGIIGIEQDIKIVMALTIHTIVFNVSGFFGGSLSDLVKTPGV